MHSPKSSLTVLVPENEKPGNEKPKLGPWWNLLTYNELEAWQQDNPHIHTGYRPISQSTKACFVSWFYIHNETINIHTHLLCALLYLLAEEMLYIYIKYKYPSATVGDQLVFAFYLLAAATCLCLSALFHTLMNHSQRVSGLWLRLDFVGIIVVTLGDYGACVHMAFYCEKEVQIIYWAVTVALSVVTIIILILPALKGPKWRTFRVCAFSLVGSSIFIPLIHGIAVFGFSEMQKQSGILYYFGGALGLLLGTICYIKRWPETFLPGKFDIVGNSHQILHVSVIFVTVIHFIGVLEAYDYNYNVGRCGITK